MPTTQLEVETISNPKYNVTMITEKRYVAVRKRIQNDISESMGMQT
jgi:hypothetical protein